MGVAAVVLHVSMSVRGAETLSVSDVIVGFLAIGLMCGASIFSFRRACRPRQDAALNS